MFAFDSLENNRIVSVVASVSTLAKVTKVGVWRSCKCYVGTSVMTDRYVFVFRMRSQFCVGVENDVCELSVFDESKMWHSDWVQQFSIGQNRVVGVFFHTVQFSVCAFVFEIEIENTYDVLMARSKSFQLGKIGGSECRSTQKK
jgi:hypothetical protein